MASWHLNCKLDQELYRALRARSQASGETISTIVRDLLRFALGTVGSTRDAGWHAGREEAYRVTRQAIETSFAAIPSNAPTHTPSKSVVPRK